MFQQSIPTVVILTIVGFMGMVTRNRTEVSFASASLLLLIIWAKIAGDLFFLPAIDTALLLAQFMIVIFLMEASLTAVAFESIIAPLRQREDDASKTARVRATRWARVQLTNLGKLSLSAFALSLSLLLLGSIISVSVNQLAFSGILAMAAFVAILFLLTYRREPEAGRRAVR